MSLFPRISDTLFWKSWIIEILNVSRHQTCAWFYRNRFRFRNRFRLSRNQSRNQAWFKTSPRNQNRNKFHWTKANEWPISAPNDRTGVGINIFWLNRFHMAMLCWNRNRYQLQSINVRAESESIPVSWNQAQVCKTSDTEIFFRGGGYLYSLHRPVRVAVNRPVLVRAVVQYRHLLHRDEAGVPATWKNVTAHSLSPMLHGYITVDKNVVVMIGWWWWFGLKGAATVLLYGTWYTITRSQMSDSNLREELLLRRVGVVHRMEHFQPAGVTENKTHVWLTIGYRDTEDSSWVRDRAATMPENTGTRGNQ